MRKLKKQSEMPHPNTLVKFILRKTERKCTPEVCDLLRTTMELSEADLDFTEVIKLYCKAAL